MDTGFATPTTTSTSTGTLSGGTLAAFIGFFALYLAIIAAMIVAMWKVFEKAGQPGWAVLVPFYNLYIWTKVAGREDWFFILFFIPFVNFFAYIVVALGVAKAFGKSPAFAIIGLLIFAPIGYLMLGFGDATYTAPALVGAAPVAPSAMPATAAPAIAPVTPVATPVTPPTTATPAPPTTPPTAPTV